MSQVVCSLYAKFWQVRPLISSNTFEKTSQVKSTVLHKKMTNWVFDPNAVITLYELETLKSCCRSWTQSASPTNTWTVHIHFSSIGSVKKNVFPSIQMLAKLQRVVCFHKRTKGVDRMSSNPKKCFLRKKYRKHLLSSFRETQSQQKIRPVPVEKKIGS